MASTAFEHRPRMGIVALVLALGLLIAPMARAAEVVLRVDGLACPFCAFGIEKKLMDVPAVAGMDIRLNDGKVILQLHEGERLDAVALKGAIDDAGFTLRKILVENAVGTLTQAGDGELLLDSTDPLFSFRLRLESEDAVRGGAAVQSPARVSVTGELTEFVAEPALLLVTSLRAVGSAAGEPE